jgi:membrane associated rhomboid family serine protease
MVLPLGDLQRTQIVPYVTYGLIAINIAMFLIQQQQGEEFTLAFAATPYEITHNEDLNQPVAKVVPVVVRDPFGGLRREQRRLVREHVPCPIPVRLTLLTSMFLHGSWMHLIGNMLYLWIVGDNVEEVLGSVRYLIVYLACGLVGSLLQILASPDSVTPTMSSGSPITRSECSCSVSSPCCRPSSSSAAGSRCNSTKAPARSTAWGKEAVWPISRTSVVR